MGKKGGAITGEDGHTTTIFGVSGMTSVTAINLVDTGTDVVAARITVPTGDTELMSGARVRGKES